MRQILKETEGERARYSGRVERFGTKTSYGYQKRTFLLRDVRDESGKEITDHLWFNLTQGFIWSGCDIGDRVSFCARSASYLKGYFPEGQSVDYKLSHPTKIEIEELAPREAA